MNGLRMVPLLLMACGVGAFRSSLPEESELGSLTAAEVCTLQEEARDFVESALSEKKLCSVVSQISGQIASAAGDGDFTTTCETAFETCQDAGPTPFVCAERILPEACVSTVAEFEACQREAVVLFRQAAKRKCDAGSESDAALAYSSECEALQASCEVGFL